MAKDQEVSGALFNEYLKPKNQTITVNVDDLNKHFITTANRLLKSEHLEPQDILKTLELYQIKLQKPTSIYNTSHINKLKKNSKIFV